MKVYSLTIDDKPVVEIEVDVPGWLPVRPTLPRRWLRGVVAQAVRGYFARCQSEAARAFDGCGA